MKLNKLETISLNPLWRALRDNPAVSLTAIQRQLKAPIANYIRLELEDIKSPGLDEIYKVIRLVTEAEEDGKLLDMINRYDYKHKQSPSMVLHIAVIKSGIRDRVTDNTLVYANGVSIPSSEQLDDRVIADLTKRGY